MAGSGFSVKRSLARFARDRRAATAVEYGLIVALIVIAMVIGLDTLGGATSRMWDILNTRVATSH